MHAKPGLSTRHTANMELAASDALAGKGLKEVHHREERDTQQCYKTNDYDHYYEKLCAPGTHLSFIHTLRHGLRGASQDSADIFVNRCRKILILFRSYLCLLHPKQRR